MVSLQMSVTRWYSSLSAAASSGRSATTRYSAYSPKYSTSAAIRLESSASSESLPFIVLDSLEALDSNRIAALVEYFGEYAAYLVVALLPEDAAALSDEYRRITEI